MGETGALLETRVSEGEKSGVVLESRRERRGDEGGEDVGATKGGGGGAGGVRRPVRRGRASLEESD